MIRADQIREVLADHDRAAAVVIAAATALTALEDEEQPESARVIGSRWALESAFHHHQDGAVASVASEPPSDVRMDVDVDALVRDVLAEFGTTDERALRYVDQFVRYLTGRRRYRPKPEVARGALEVGQLPAIRDRARALLAERTADA